MKIYRSSIRSGVPLKIDEDELDWRPEEFATTFPLLGIKDAHICGQFEKCGDIVTFNGVISGTLVLSDARTSEPFDEEVEVDDIINLLEDDEDEEGEGYIFPGNGIQTHDIIFSVLRSETPIKPLKKGSKLPLGGPGWSVVQEGEEKREKSSPFDVLLDLDLEENEK